MGSPFSTVTMTLRKTLTPFYYLTFIFGITPFIWRTPPIKKSCELIIIYLIALLNFGVDFKDTFEWTSKSIKGLLEKRLISIIQFTIKLLFSIANLLSVIVCVGKRKEFRAVIQHLERVDRKLLQLNMKVNHRREWKINLIAFTISQILFGVYLAVVAQTLHYPRNISNLIYLFIRLELKYTFMEMITLYTVFIQRSILVRFQAVNQGLVKYFISENILEMEEENILFQLATIHDLLATAYRLHFNSLSLQVKNNSSVCSLFIY